MSSTAFRFIRERVARRALAASACICAIFAGASNANAQSGVLLYAPNSASNTVSTYAANADGTLTSTGAPIPVGTQPLMVALRGDQAFAYVTNASDNSVSVIDTSTRTVVQTVTGVLGLPQRVVVSSDGTRLYVVSNGGQLYTFSINLGTGQLTQIATLATGLNQPRGLAIAPDGNTAYVAAASGANVGVIDTATNTVTTTISVGSIPVGISVNPAGTRVYVSNVGSNTVSVIDTTTYTVIATVPTGSAPTGTVVAPDGVHWYVTNQNAGTVSQFNTSDNSAVAAPAATGSTPLGLTASPDGKALYVTNRGADDRVQAYSIAPATGALTSIGTVAAGDDPAIPGICSNGNALLASGRTFLATTAGALGCTGSTPAVTIAGGTLRAGAANVFGSSNSLSLAAGTVDLNNFPQTIASLLGSGNVALGSGTLTIAPPVGNFPFSGPISGTGGVTVAGSSPLAGLNFLGANTYTGPTTVASGTLIVSGSLAAGSAVSVASGARLWGSGTAAGPVTVDGELAPGAGTPGQLATGSLTMNASGVLSIELNGTTAGTGYDRVNVAGTVTLNNPTLTLTGTYTPVLGDQFILISNDGADPVNGTFSGLPEGATLTLNGRVMRISYAGGDGNDVALVAATFTVTPNISGSGTIVPNTPQTVLGGTTVTFTLSPNVGTTPAVTGLCGGSLVGNTYTTGPVTADCVAIISFFVNLYNVTSSAGANGTITPLGTAPVPHGSTKTFTVTPNAGYTASVGGTCGGSLVGNTYTTNAITAACTVIASFSQVTFTVTPSAGANGTISPNTPQTVAQSATTTFTVTPNAGYAATVGGTCGGTLAGTTYTTNAITANCTVSATFSATAVTTFSGPTATGTGTGSVVLTGGGATCGFTTAQFIPVSGNPASPPAGTAPAVDFPHGLFDFRLAGCTPGSTVTLTITYPSALPAGSSYWKYGPEPGNATPHWYVMPATLGGATAMLSIVDGQQGDDDLAANGAIVDQGGPGMPIATAAPQQTPTLSEWAMLLLATLLMGFGMAGARRRERRE